MHQSFEKVLKCLDLGRASSSLCTFSLLSIFEEKSSIFIKERSKCV